MNYGWEYVNNSFAFNKNVNPKRHYNFKRKYIYIYLHIRRIKYLNLTISFSYRRGQTYWAMVRKPPFFPIEEFTSAHICFFIFYFRTLKFKTVNHYQSPHQTSVCHVLISSFPILSNAVFQVAPTLKKYVHVTKFMSTFFKYFVYLLYTFSH